ncbi:hypothetical protein B0T17DRAFT_37661 [Bombardia bombarda]|uniref:Uncharacterized protein n=1 Tax=Bombardia bombarda TaxID=252184 RepID=A0AA40CFA3_9PEZI|nr:hypothetical protein B0T17DRAFT_37661 [Bombardia bombarda]
MVICSGRVFVCAKQEIKKSTALPPPHHDPVVAPQLLSCLEPGSILSTSQSNSNSRPFLRNTRPLAFSPPPSPVLTSADLHSVIQLLRPRPNQASLRQVVSFLIFAPRPASSSSSMRRRRMLPMGPGHMPQYPKPISHHVTLYGQPFSFSRGQTQFILLPLCNSSSYSAHDFRRTQAFTKPTPAPTHCNYSFATFLAHRADVHQDYSSKFASLNCPRPPLVYTKATCSITASSAVKLVSDQDFSLRKTFHIINSLPPPAEVL